MDVTIIGTGNMARGIHARRRRRSLGHAALNMAIQPALGTNYASAVKVLA